MSAEGIRSGDSVFNHVARAPEDPILGVTVSYNKDPSPVKLNLGVGAYRTESYAKNMGLYGERVGALSIVCKSADVASRVESQLKVVIRPMHSNPPIHGASIVAFILRDRQWYNEWTVELKAMADRFIRMRYQLYSDLQERGTPGDWSHIIKQIGMFTFTGLNSKQVVFRIPYLHDIGQENQHGWSFSSATFPHLGDAIHAAITRVG